MGKYVVGPFYGDSIQALAQTLLKELQEIANASEYAEAVIFPVLHTPPEKFDPGMIVYADGTNWDPGSGEGIYRRNAANSAWVFVG